MFSWGTTTDIHTKRQQTYTNICTYRHTTYIYQTSGNRRGNCNWDLGKF